MTTVYDIEADKLIGQVAKDLKENVKLAKPEWAAYVKTGTHKDGRPEDPDWWWVRAAAILRRIYIDGPVGVQRLRTLHGGKKNRGRRPEEFRRAGGKIIRVVLQSLDQLGLTETKGPGRVITAKGRSYLDKHAASLSRGK